MKLPLRKRSSMPGPCQLALETEQRELEWGWRMNLIIEREKKGSCRKCDIIGCQYCKWRNLWKSRNGSVRGRFLIDWCRFWLSVGQEELSKVFFRMNDGSDILGFGIYLQGWGKNGTLSVRAVGMAFFFFYTLKFFERSSIYTLIYHSETLIQRKKHFAPRNSCQELKNRFHIVVSEIWPI